MTTDSGKRELKKRGMDQLANEIVDQIFSFLPAADQVSLGLTSKSHQLLLNAFYEDKIKKEFKRQIPKLPHLLTSMTIYRHLQLLKQMHFWERRLYSSQDPALFQSALKDEGEAETINPKALLDKAAAVGNLRLVTWLLSPQRAHHAWLCVDAVTLSQGIRSGNKALVRLLSLPRAKGGGDIGLLGFIADCQKIRRFYPPYLPENLLAQKLLVASVDTEQLSDRRTMLDTACKLGDLATVKDIVTKHGIRPAPANLEYAVDSGEFDLVHWLIVDSSLTPSQTTLDRAARSGNLILVQMLIKDHGLIPNDETLRKAALSGEAELVDWLITTYKLLPNAITVYAVACAGNLDLFERLCRDHKLTPPKYSLFAASESGNQSLFELLEKKYESELPRDPTKQMLVAEENNRWTPSLLKYLASPERGEKRLDFSVPLGAVKVKDESLLKFLILNYHFKLTKEALSNIGGFFHSKSLIMLLMAEYGNFITGDWFPEECCKARFGSSWKTLLMPSASPASLLGSSLSRGCLNPDPGGKKGKRKREKKESENPSHGRPKL